MQIAILYKVLVFVRKQNQIRMRAPELQEKSKAFLDILSTET